MPNPALETLTEVKKILKANILQNEGKFDGTIILEPDEVKWVLELVDYAIGIVEDY